MVSRVREILGPIDTLVLNALGVKQQSHVFDPCPLAQEMHVGIRGSQMIAFEGGHLFSFMKERQPCLDAIAKFLQTENQAPLD
ncbi:hypothetical protein KSD_77980 [Ktedonobacter sp. SOSP1-85]|nr:hypothetical protein KSD_77980 [Ktedonobacter sp. SOSP1-85]